MSTLAIFRGKFCLFSFSCFYDTDDPRLYGLLWNNLGLSVGVFTDRTGVSGRLWGQAAWLSLWSWAINPQLPHLQNGHNNNAYFISLL